MRIVHAQQNVDQLHTPAETDCFQQRGLAHARRIQIGKENARHIRLIEVSARLQRPVDLPPTLRSGIEDKLQHFDISGAHSL